MYQILNIKLNIIIMYLLKYNSLLFIYLIYIRYITFIKLFIFILYIFMHIIIYNLYSFITGKTAIIQRYTKGHFSPNYKLTIGVDFAVKTLTWDSKTKIHLQLWSVFWHILIILLTFNIINMFTATWATHVYCEFVSCIYFVICHWCTCVSFGSLYAL